MTHENCLHTLIVKKTQSATPNTTSRTYILHRYKQLNGWFSFSDRAQSQTLPEHAVWRFTILLVPSLSSPNLERVAHVGRMWFRVIWITKVSCWWKKILILLMHVTRNSTYEIARSTALHCTAHCSLSYHRKHLVLPALKYLGIIRPLVGY